MLLIRFILIWYAFTSFVQGVALFSPEKGLPLWYWRQKEFVNFGDHLSLKIVERIVGQSVHVLNRKPSGNPKKLLAIGSILSFAEDGDVVWGTGLNGKVFNLQDYRFSRLDVRAVRGPLTRAFLWDHFQIYAPAIYGDPALLFPILFPEFRKNENPSRPFIVIPHYSERRILPLHEDGSIVYPTEPWDEVILKILDSKFVISSSLHGIIIAEAYGIPARYIRLSETENLLKYDDYYLGTGRKTARYATSIEEALIMGGEEPPVCDLEALFFAFPFEYWPQQSITIPEFLN